MSTRSLTFVTENERTPFVCMYRQSDGYPSGMGVDLYKFLQPVKMVDGIGLSDLNLKIANGAGCLAAQLVAHFKEGAGGIYLYPPHKNMDCNQEYEYWIDVTSSNKINVTVFDVTVFDGYRRKGVVMFKGSVNDYGLWLETRNEH